MTKASFKNAFQKKAEIAKPGQGPARSLETGLYYKNPTGSLFYSYKPNGYGYYPDFLVVSPFESYTLTNMAPNPSQTVWTLRGDDASDLVDGNGNFSYIGTPGWMLPAPTLSNASGTDTYNVSELNTSYEDDPNNYYTRITCDDDLNWMSFVQDHTGMNPWGALDNDNMCGTGTYTTDDGTVLTSTAVTQMYPAPASPLYVDSIYVEGITIGSAAYKNGAKLTLNLYDANTNEKLYTLTSGAEDYTNVISDTRNNKTVTLGTSVFVNKVTDDFGNEVIDPIVIDRAVKAELTGFENADIDFGPVMYEYTAADVMADVAQVVLKDMNNPSQELQPLTYRGSLALGLKFHGFMDKAYAVTAISFQDGTDQTGYNIIRISDDGKTNSTEGKTGTDYALPCAWIETATPWFDTEGNEQYYFELPDWIQSIQVDNSYYDPTGENNTTGNPDFRNYVAFIADPLPAGTTGREAVVYVKGRGYTDSTPIVLLQGDAKVPTGIENVVTDKNKADKNAPVYNLNGQRVSKSTKGILIQNGKKFINAK